MAGRYKKEGICDINVTNLVDVTMVLLIIFILVAPMIEQGIDLRLPEASPSKIEADKNSVTVSISKYGQVFLNSERVEMDAFSERMQNLKETNPTVSVVVRGDEDVKYGRIVGVLDAIRTAGITKLDMATRGKE
ncbi:MAG: biopolymer transporter ExbD [Candidatus Theseobacter exili]|nr:biopolymer transporter ExbD [Candidatus Theseobacter exili]